MSPGKNGREFREEDDQCVSPKQGVCQICSRRPMGLLWLERSERSVSISAGGATTHLCCCSTKRGKDNTSENGGFCVPIKLYLQNQMVAVLTLQTAVC